MLSTVGSTGPAGRPPDGPGRIPQAVLWDMDGTLVDTEPYWIEVEHEIAERYGGTWSHAHALNLVGNDLIESGRYIREHAGIDVEPAQIVEELLARLGEQGIPCALVTMSYRRFVAPILDSLAPDTFEVVVTGDAVTQGKPHPEPYLKAAAILGVDPAGTIAIEDSNTGARSAEAAGCTVLVVENHVPVLPGDRRVFVDTLAGMTADDLPSPGAVVRLRADVRERS